MDFRPAARRTRSTLISAAGVQSENVRPGRMFRPGFLLKRNRQDAAGYLV